MHAPHRALAYTDMRMPRAAKSSPAAPAPYLRPEAITFLRNLAKHNDRDWFAPRKAQFEAQLKEPMLAIVRKITDAMMDFAPNHVRPAEKSLFRIYRDTRFSARQAALQDARGGVVVAPGARENFGRRLLLPGQPQGRGDCGRRIHAGEGTTGSDSELAARQSRRIFERS